MRTCADQNTIMMAPRNKILAAHCSHSLIEYQEGKQKANMDIFINFCYSRNDVGIKFKSDLNLLGVVSLKETNRFREDDAFQ